MEAASRCCLLSFFCHKWNLNSPTRDKTCTLCTGTQGLNHWATRKVQLSFLWKSQLNGHILWLLTTNGQSLPPVLKLESKEQEEEGKETEVVITAGTLLVTDSLRCPRPFNPPQTAGSLKTAGSLNELI